MTLQPHQPSIPLLTQDTFTAVTLPDHVDIVIRNDRRRLDLAAREPKDSDLEKRLATPAPKLSSTEARAAPADIHWSNSSLFFGGEFWCC